MEMNMSEDTNNGTPQRLTSDDPISPEQLNQLALLQNSHQDIAERLLVLEKEKVKLLASSRRLDDERQRVFEGILIERGIDPHAEVEIDASTGKIRLFTPPQSQPSPQPPS
jgi:hypothetical protein